MSRAAIVWLVVGISLVLVGGLIFVSVMMGLGWRFDDMSTVDYETNEHIIEEAFDNISILTETALVKLLPSTDGSCRVVCEEVERAWHRVYVKDGTLSVEIDDTRAWYENIGIDIGRTSVTVYLPAGAFGSLDVESTTGDITIRKDFSFAKATVESTTGKLEFYATVKDELEAKTTTGDMRIGYISVGDMSISSTTGDIIITSVSCLGDIYADVTSGEMKIENTTAKSIVSRGSTGDLMLKGVRASYGITLERSTGDVMLDEVNASVRLWIKTTTGSVRGTLLDKKIFIIETTTGSVSVPKTSSGATCEITTTTGDIKIEIED